VELVDHVIPGRDLRTGRGPGRPPLVPDAEIGCLAVAQVLLRFYDERHWMRGAITGRASVPAAAGTKRVQRAGQTGSGADSEQFFTDCDLVLVRPARGDEKTPRPFPNWLRQRIEAIIWTLKSQLGLEQHRARVSAGLWARILQRLLALNTAIWHNWTSTARCH
jgi:hypothetical protein